MGRNLEKQKEHETIKKVHQKPTDLDESSTLFDASHYISEQLQGDPDPVVFLFFVCFLLFWNESVNPKQGDRDRCSREVTA